MKPRYRKSFDRRWRTGPAIESRYQSLRHMVITAKAFLVIAVFACEQLQTCCDFSIARFHTQMSFLRSLGEYFSNSWWLTRLIAAFCLHGTAFKLFRCCLSKNFCRCSNSSRILLANHFKAPADPRLGTSKYARLAREDFPNICFGSRNVRVNGMTQHRNCVRRLKENKKTKRVA